MKYYLFIDESGDHGLTNIDQNFPVFTLCGVIFSETNHSKFTSHIQEVKNKYWKSQGVIFHSRDIRKCDKEFSILFDLDLKKEFYTDLNSLVTDSQYAIISAVVKKEDYIKKYGKSGNVYAIALSFIIERTIFYLDTQPNVESIEIIVEKRGANEDLELSKYYNQVISRGTFYVTPDRFSNCNMTLRFKSKKENINGLQLADLIAYPISTKINNPERVNPAFKLFENKFYRKFQVTYGLKVFP